MKKAYVNGNVISVNEKGETFEAFAVEDGVIVKTGSSEEIKRYGDLGYEIRDLNGKTVVPGFNDSHLHLLNYAYSLTKIDCNGLGSIEEMIEEGRKYIKERQVPPGKWVQGRGWNQVFLKENRPPSRDDLDRI